MNILNLPSHEEQVNQNAILQSIATSLGGTSGALKSAIDVANASAVNADAKASDIESRFQQLTATQQQDAEVIDARQGELSLAANLTRIRGTQVNVKDYGAVGDGTTDDKVAIVAAFDYAIAHLPAEVYFPKGDYGILHGGIYVTLPLGSSGLTVRGDGARLSRIKYLEAWQTNGSWVALRIQPASTPSNDAEFLHDICVRDIGVLDTDPVAHAWNIAEGDIATEETHGFDINYTINAQYLNCGIWSVGDEALDMVACKDSVISNCYVYNSPAAGASGGAISVGDGCVGVRVTNNTVESSIATKSNFGIAIESLGVHGNVSDIVVANNIVRNINGNAFNLGAPGGAINNVTYVGNVVDNCTVGFSSAGGGGINNIIISDTIITNCTRCINATASNSKHMLVDNLIADTVSDQCININHSLLKLCGVTLRNLQNQAMYISGDNSTIENVLIDGVGIATGITAAIAQYPGEFASIARNIKILNCKTKYGIQNIETVINANITLDESIVGCAAIVNPKFVTGGTMNGIITGIKEKAIIKNVTINILADPGNHAIVLNNINDCIVSGCSVTIPARYGIRETGTADYNIITSNNVRNAGLKLSVIGENTIQANNMV